MFTRPEWCRLNEMVHGHTVSCLACSKPSIIVSAIDFTLLGDGKSMTHRMALDLINGPFISVKFE